MAEIRANATEKVLATAYWATSAQGGDTRRGVVLTYLLSLVIGSLYINVEHPDLDIDLLNRYPHESPQHASTTSENETLGSVAQINKRRVLCLFIRSRVCTQHEMISWAEVKDAAVRAPVHCVALFYGY